MQDRVPDGPKNGKDRCAIAVTYHPDAEFPTRIKRILPQVRALLIVDNGSGETEITMLRDLPGNPLITLLLNSNNLGAASALNIGIAHAVRRGFRWVLLRSRQLRQRRHGG